MRLCSTPSGINVADTLKLHLLLDLADHVLNAFRHQRSGHTLRQRRRVHDPVQCSTPSGINVADTRLRRMKRWGTSCAQRLPAST